MGELPSKCSAVIEATEQYSEVVFKDASFYNEKS